MYTLFFKHVFCWFEKIISLGTIHFSMYGFAHMSKLDCVTKLILSFFGFCLEKHSQIFNVDLLKDFSVV